MVCRSLFLLACRVLMIVWLALAQPSSALAAGGQMPSTLSSSVGAALLCKDHVDPHYFWTNLERFMGKPYKTEGGAYWFKVQGNMWGAEITDVLVSDGQAELIFLAAQFKGGPDKLAEAILAATGIKYVKETAQADSPLVSGLGSRIVFAGGNSKIYCKQYNLDYSRSHSH